MPIASALVGLILLAAEPTSYCTGQRVVDGAVAYFANGQRVVDGFGKEYYPNGVRLTNDYGDEVRYSNGGRVRSATGEILFPNGTSVRSATGQARYPNGQQTRTSTGTCYFETGIEMRPCQRVVTIRDRLAGGETAIYQLDIVDGTVDLRTVRYEFPTATALITLTADLAAGRLDRGSLGATCPSGATR
jgi:hypothetical protein